MVDGYTKETRLLHDAPTNANILQYSVTDLEPGHTYSFRILAINFNGAGAEWSDLVSFRSCGYPSGVPLPKVVQQTSTQFTFRWMQPQDDGGCETLTYELFLDNKVTGLLELAYSGPSHVEQATIAVESQYVG
jgi:hypothetical protein